MSSGAIVTMPSCSAASASSGLPIAARAASISPALVRVRYVFRNRAAQPRRITVAFPMPDRDLSYEMESEVAYPGDFHTLVEGRPVRMSVERRAILNGVDRTAELHDAHSLGNA
jgi:hypothetical protein